MRCWKQDRGQSLIEFALVLPMLLAVCIGMAEIGRVTWAWNLAQQAAAEGARRAIVVSNAAWSDTAVAAAQRMLRANQITTPGMLKKTTITPILDETTTPSTVQVNVDVPIALLMGLSFWGNDFTYTVHGRARMDCQPAFYKPPA